MNSRIIYLERKTSETNISVKLNLDGTGVYQINTGIGFFDHMLELFSKHSLMDLEIIANGDLHIEAHHTVEDIGIALGDTMQKALGEKKGIQRYGSCLLPMDETLIGALPVYPELETNAQDYIVESIFEFFQANQNS